MTTKSKVRTWEEADPDFGGDVMVVRLEDYETLQADYQRLQAESLEMVQVLAESRANDRQAMYYLNQVREVVGGDNFPDTIEKIKEMQSELNAHKASRIAYASEFPLGADGTPDVGSIHENIRLLKKDAALRHAEIVLAALAYHKGSKS